MVTTTTKRRKTRGFVVFYSKQIKQQQFKVTNSTTMPTKVTAPGLDLIRLPAGVSDNDVATMNNLIAQCFQNAQKSVSSHRKVVATLKNIQDKAVSAGLESHVNLAFCRMVNLVLPVKKSEGCADRIVKLVESFVTYIQQKETEQNPNKTNNEEDEESDTVGSRFVECLISHLLRGIESKDKIVRFRVCQLIAVTINHLGEISDELFDDLKENLCKRLYDKEQTVRLQSALALSRLQGVDEDDDDGTSVSKLLVSVLQHDSSADVRRAVLFNLEKNTDNLPYLLERAWDTHPTNRRMVYSRTMKEISDFRLLSIGMREKILQWGLQDRDSGVKAAATKMFVDQWLETTNNDLLEVLERLDVLNSKIAETAMTIFFENRKDTLNKIELSNDFWTSLSAESVFLARTFNSFCVQHRLTELIESRMPELTKLAGLIGYYLHELQKIGHANSSDKNKVTEIEFIVEQLLIIAETYDYADEVGRRNTLGLLRDAVVNEEINDNLIQRAVEVIRKLSVNERDFSQVLLEMISDVRDTVTEGFEAELKGSEEEDEQEEEDDDDDGQEEEEGEIDGQHKRSNGKSKKPTAEQAEKELFALLKCLSVAQSGLELIANPLETNVHLTSLLNSLIIPSIRSHEAPVRERGLRCLGLSCLLSKELSIDNLMLFCHCFTKGHDILQMEAIKIISDILMIHGISVLDVEGGVDTMSIYKLYYKAVRNNDEPEVQAVAAESLCKLFLAGVIAEEDLLKTLVLAFFDGASADNLALRQILSFCLPVYCYSSNENQQRMGKIVIDGIRRLTRIYDNCETEMINPSQIMQHLVEWTDPQRIVGHDAQNATSSTVHLALCQDVLARLKEVKNKDERKALCWALNKLVFPGSINPNILRELNDAVEEVIEVSVRMHKN